jgi:D-alanyl-lipoteichoic acid acyltransferase DltB (MBOAT superfamily)
MVWKPSYIILLLFTTLVHYYFSLKIYHTEHKNEKRLYLNIALFVSLGLLFIFKYFNFINTSFSSLFSYISIDYPFKTVDILLPMGISFYTFQVLGYTIDVYRGKIKPEKTFLRLTLFITFFPQLLAGPIARADQLIPQLFKKQEFSINRTVEGLQLMLIGYFKKVVVADRLSIIVNTVYNNVYNYSGLYFVVATVLFAFQIYCDFSAYSEIALGCAKILGIELMRNFERPYFSKTIKEFWRRWHISLSTWFKDYLYIPLGGNRVGSLRQKINLLTVFLVSGLWHGANWTFVIWGALHGLYQIMGGITSKLRERLFVTLKLQNTRLLKLMQIFITFCLVCFAWIFFRANTIADAFYVVLHLFDDFSKWTSIRYVYDTVTNMGVNLFEFIIATISVVLLVAYEFLSRQTELYERLNNSNFVVKGAFYMGLIALILTMGVYHSASQFIYFQF